MRHFTEHRDSSPPNLSAEEAITLITSRVVQLEPERQLNKNLLQFWVEKLTFDILDYCHRRDFPYALIYTCVDLIRKRIDDSEEAAEETSTLPLSEIKMDDTQFKFDTAFALKKTAPDNAGLLSDLDFDTIKPKLNRYRKLVSK